MQSVFNFACTETPIIVTPFDSYIYGRYYVHLLQKCKYVDIYEIVPNINIFALDCTFANDEAYNLRRKETACYLTAPAILN